MARNSRDPPRGAENPVGCKWSRVWEVGVVEPPLTPHRARKFPQLQVRRQRQGCVQNNLPPHRRLAERASAETAFSSRAPPRPSSSVGSMWWH